LANPVVQISAVSKVFASGSGGASFTAVDDVTLDVERGEVVCIVGRTGCGKSTLVSMLLGLETPTRGEIRIDGLSPSRDFLEMRGRLAAVFQTDRLLPWYNIVDNAALGLEARREPREQRRAAASKWLERVGLGGWENAYPHQLSGGMRQRVAIARAFAVDPAVVLLDEAFGHLDEVTAQALRDDCMDMVRQSGRASLVVTHNITEALELGNRVAVLDRPARVIGSYDLTQARTRPDWPAYRDSLKDEIFAKIGLKEGV
jgi:NitT/TauT family transport system ATP-binding protein